MTVYLVYILSYYDEPDELHSIHISMQGAEKAKLEIENSEHDMFYAGVDIEPHEIQE